MDRLDHLFELGVAYFAVLVGVEFADLRNPELLLLELASKGLNNFLNLNFPIPVFIKLVKCALHLLLSKALIRKCQCRNKLIIRNSPTLINIKPPKKRLNLCITQSRRQSRKPLDQLFLANNPILIQIKVLEKRSVFHLFGH